MEKLNWTSSDIVKLFKLDGRVTKQTLFNNEERGEIPTATRIPRGRVQIRTWSLEQVPKIGEKFGYLKPLKQQLVICVYIQKGGVLKTSTTYNRARMLALNGIKVLLIGTDYECSITDVTLPKKDIKTLSEIDRPLGLYHFFYERANIKDVIQKTSIPTFDIIPETHELNLLEKRVRHEKRREYFFRDKLIPSLSEYDVIIFDNGPSWHHLIENTITASNVILSPLGCNLLAYQAAKTNLGSMHEFIHDMKLTNLRHVMIATLLDNNSGISQQIYGRYLDKYGKTIIPIPIRKSTKGEESLANRQSVIEYAPSSNLADDYYKLIKSEWEIFKEALEGR